MLARGGIASLRTGAASSVAGVARRHAALSASPSAASSALLHTSSRRQEASHGTSAHASEQDEEHYPSEGFGAPIWRYTFLAVIGTAAFVRWTSTRQTHVPSNSDGDDEENNDANLPFLTRYIAYNMPDKAQWISNQDKHIDGVRQSAENRVFFQDAQRPPMYRSRYPRRADNCSPGKLAVGDQVDMSSST